MVIGPVLTLVSTVVALAFFADVAALGYGGLYAFEIAIDVLFLGYMVYVATRFFAKKRIAPVLVIILLAARVGLALLTLLVELSVGAELFANESVKALLGGIIAAAIWIPYFKTSRQVAVTFVN